MAISEELRELVVAFGNAKMRQGVCNQPGYTYESKAAIQESKEAFDKLCYELNELERYATNWHDHRCY